MKERTSWSDWLPIVTMALGIGACAVGFAMYRWYSAELRLLFFIISLTAFLFLALCLAFAQPPRWPAAVGIVPLALFWIALVVVPRNSHRNVSRLQMYNDAKLNGLSLLRYDDDNKHLPRDLRDDAGKPILSWRLYLCPYIDQAPLYKQLDLKQSWDSPANRRFLEKAPWPYRSVFAGDGDEDKTPWQGFVGPGLRLNPTDAS